MGSYCVARLARCVKYVMYCCDGYLTKAMEWNRFFWFMGQGDIVTGGHDGNLGQMVTLYPLSGRERAECWDSASFSCFTQPRPQPVDSIAHIWGVFLPQLTLSRRFLTAQRFVSMVILNTTKLALGIWPLWMWWYTSVTPPSTPALGRLRWDALTFGVSLGYIV